MHTAPMDAVVMDPADKTMYAVVIPELTVILHGLTLTAPAEHVQRMYINISHNFSFHCYHI